MIVDRIPKNFDVNLEARCCFTAGSEVGPDRCSRCRHHQEVADQDLSGVLLGMQDFMNEHWVYPGAEVFSKRKF